MVRVATLVAGAMAAVAFVVAFALLQHPNPPHETHRQDHSYDHFWDSTQP